MKYEERTKAVYAGNNVIEDVKNLLKENVTGASWELLWHFEECPEELQTEVFRLISDEVHLQMGGGYWESMTDELRTMRDGLEEEGGEE